MEESVSDFGWEQEWERERRKVKDRIQECIETRETDLFLYNERLVNLPTSVCSCRHITSINLAFNQLKALPESMTSLASLLAVNLARNSFSSFPDVLCHMTRLERLQMQENELQLIPTSIGYLVNLRVLALHHNKLSYLPPSISNLLRLQTLELHANQFRSISPSLGALSPVPKHGYRGMRGSLTKITYHDNPLERELLMARDGQQFLDLLQRRYVEGFSGGEEANEVELDALARRSAHEEGSAAAAADSFPVSFPPLLHLVDRLRDLDEAKSLLRKVIVDLDQEVLKRTRAEVELKKMKQERYHDDDYQLRDELSRLRATVAELKLELQAERSKKRVEHVAVSRRQSIETLADRQWQRSPEVSLADSRHESDEESMAASYMSPSKRREMIKSSHAWEVDELALSSCLTSELVRVSRWRNCCL